MNCDAGHLCCFGFSLDTGNLGVSALGMAVIAELGSRLGDDAVVVFDHSHGCQEQRLDATATSVRYRRCGARWSRNPLRRDSWHNIRLGMVIPPMGNPASALLRGARAVADISGGDSFTDLYGMGRRWRYVNMPKKVALRLGAPLVLLPQTYGPFASPRARATAERIVRGARAAWARDARSFDTLRDLTGADFDPDRHRAGVDVAFLLDTLQPDAVVRDRLPAWFTEPDGAPLAGLNVSGLVWNDPDRACARFGLKCEYRDAVRTIARRILADPDARLLLVPHVITPEGHYESDPGACAALARELGAPGRVAVAPAVDDPRVAKWMIARCDWFCGTRMHATIAALSSGVPTATLAYSLKARGVFECCGQGAHVADMRSLDADAAIERVWSSWAARGETRAPLARALPATLATAHAQFDAVADLIDPAWRGRDAQAPTPALERAAG